MGQHSVQLSSFSKDKVFLAIAQKLGLETLEDVMAVKLHVLRKQRAFSYSWYYELLDILKQRNLLIEFTRKQL